MATDLCRDAGRRLGAPRLLHLHLHPLRPARSPARGAFQAARLPLLPPRGCYSRKLPPPAPRHAHRGGVIAKPLLGALRYCRYSPRTAAPPIGPVVCPFRADVVTPTRPVSTTPITRCVATVIRPPTLAVAAVAAPVATSAAAALRLTRVVAPRAVAVCGCSGCSGFLHGLLHTPAPPFTRVAAAVRPTAVPASATHVPGPPLWTAALWNLCTATLNHLCPALFDLPRPFCTAVLPSGAPFCTGIPYRLPAAPLCTAVPYCFAVPRLCTGAPGAPHLRARGGGLASVTPRLPLSMVVSQDVVTQGVSQDVVTLGVSQDDVTLGVSQAAITRLIRGWRGHCTRTLTFTLTLALACVLALTLALACVLALTLALACVLALTFTLALARVLAPTLSPSLVVD